MVPKSVALQTWVEGCWKYSLIKSTDPASIYWPLDQPLNVPETIETSALNQIKQQLVIAAMIEEADAVELCETLDGASDRKTSDGCRIPTEIWKNGEPELIR